MARGDQIYVMRPLIGMDSIYEHHGIDCGDGTVIHYHKGKDAVVTRTSYEAFARGKPVFTKHYAASYIPDVVVERAESRLGERQYNLLSNNCEHFATWCKVGRSESQQVIDYGLDMRQVNPFTSQQLIREAVQEGDPIEAVAMYNQALGNLAIAQSQLESQYSKAQDDVITWDRVARLALKRDREDLARAALDRKVESKRKAEKLLDQLAQLTETQETLKRNGSALKQKVTQAPI